MGSINRQGAWVRGVSITGPGVASVSELESPTAGTGEVLVAPLAVGLCATDLELISGDMAYLRSGQARLPLVPGHEWVGRVLGVGPGGADHIGGSLVVGECSIGCMTCSSCRSGAYHRCLSRRETGILNLDGALAGLMAFPARAVHCIPDGLGLDDAALTEPSAVAYHAVQRCGTAVQSRVLIVGAGTIGWLCVALLQVLLRAEVSVLEPDPVRLNRVLSLGARAPEADEVFDHVIDASGHPDGLTSAQQRLAAGGRLVVVGLTGRVSNAVDIDGLVVKEQELVGSLGSPGVWSHVIGLLADGALRPSQIVTHRFPLSDIDEALAVLNGERGDVGKVGKVLIFPQDSDRGLTG